MPNTSLERTRARRISSALSSALCFAGLAGIAAIGLAVNITGRAGAAELSEIRGHLKEWSILGEKHALLRLSIEESDADFRLDPKYFRVFDQKVSPDFRAGAAIAILAKQSELAVGGKSPLLSDVKIV